MEELIVPGVPESCDNRSNRLRFVLSISSHVTIFLGTCIYIMRPFALKKIEMQKSDVNLIPFTLLRFC